MKITRTDREFPLSEREVEESNVRAARVTVNPVKLTDEIGIALAKASGWLLPHHEKNEVDTLTALDRFFTDVETISGKFWLLLGGLSHLSFVPAGLLVGWKDGSPVSLYLSGGLAFVAGDRSASLYVGIVAEAHKLVLWHGRDIIGEYNTPTDVWTALSAYIARKGAEK